MKRSGALWRIGLSAILALLVSEAVPPSQAQQRSGSTSVASKLFADDPVHQAGLEASANHKIVFVLGEGFHKFPIISLKNRLGEIGLVEGKHYEIMTDAKAPQKAGVLYVEGQLVKLQPSNQPFVFRQHAANEAVVVIENAIKAGTLTVR